MFKNTSLRSCLVAVSVIFIATQAVAEPARTTRIRGNISGIFTNPSGGTKNTGVGTNEFTWGVGAPTPSRLKFTGKSFDVNVTSGYVYGPRARNNREVFSLGTLEYYNGAIRYLTGADSVHLFTTAQITYPVETNPTTIVSRFDLITTPNEGDPIASADSVFLPKNLPPVVLNTFGGAPLTLEIPGFGNITGEGFSTTDGFSVLEEETAQADLLGRFTSPCEPIIDNAVRLSTIDEARTIQAKFTPNFNLKISEAANLCGYDHFNWYQIVTNDPYPPTKNGQPLKVPYIDRSSPRRL
jgi:hypothetical protein